MGRTCHCCEHPERDAIDAALVSGASMTEVSDRFGVSRSSASRHSLNHLSASLVAMKAQAQEDNRASLLERIETLIERGETMFAAAASEGKAAQALAVLKELRSLLELLGKASGELNDRPQVTVNLMASPEWLQLRSALLGALLPFPDARVAAAAVLELPAADVTEEAS